MANEMLSNRYILVKPVGSGGMADVYLAIDSILKREVAVKILRGELAQDPVNLARFQKEAMAISNTSHPNIVEIFDVGEDQGKNYIVMEYVHGKTLKQLIRQRGSIPIDETVNIMKQLTSAVAHAHKVGIIHRDIKTQNVLVKDDGTVKLSDFGIAYTGDATQLTQADTIMGSVHYLAPELASGEICTPQSDIYSLGIVFYEMLTGSVPFKGETPVEIALKHLHDEVPSVIEYNSQIPQSLENIVIKATAKKKEQRYKSADEMYNDIVTCLDLSRNNESRINLKKKETAVKEEKKKEIVKKNLDFSSIVLISLAVVLSVALIIAFKSLSETPDVEELTIPAVTEYQLEDAKDALLQMGFNVDTITYESSDTIEKGKVIRTLPSAGSTADKGTFVTIIVSEGLNFTFEDYVGSLIRTVQSKLENNGFIVTVEEVQTNQYEAGTILEQSVAEGKVFKPSDSKTVIFKVAALPSDIIPADIIGKKIEDAKKQLEDKGFMVTLTQLPIEENIGEDGQYLKEVGTVISCDPQPGSLYTQSDEKTITLTYY